MKLRRGRLLALLLGTASALGLGWIAKTRWLEARRPATVSLADLAADLQALLDERARAGPITPQDPLDLVREPIPPDVAERLFTVLRSSAAGSEYDPFVGVRYRGGLARRIPFAERPEGEWLFRTNSLGLREDAEVATEKPALRVLVAGDSQTEGYCDNAESWPNVLEARLASLRPGRAVEVLNAGKSGYSFYSYLGTLERFLRLHPDVFVMCVYGGNDFVECLLTHHYFRRTKRPFCAACERDRMVELHPENTFGIFAQAFHQLVYFRHHPEERKVALEAAFSVTAGVERLCRERGIRLVCVYLPPLVDAQPGLLGSLLGESVALFELQPDDLQIANRLADAWLEFARARGISTIDLRVAISEARRPLYWDRDHHVSVEGNRVIAEALLTEVGAGFR